MPYLLTGWCFTPLPKRLPCISVVGEPVHSLPMTDPNGVVTQEAIDEMHQRYYAAVKKLWAVSRELHPMYKDFVLQFDGNLEEVT